MKPLRDEAVPDVAAAAGDCRCLCGSLLARMLPGGVELKCRRCKRTLLVPFEVRAGRLAIARERRDPRPVSKAP